MAQDRVQDKLSFVHTALAERRQSQRFRTLQTVQPVDTVQVQRTKPLINFSSNDYLGLSKHPALIAAAQDYTARYGTGATASRLVTGTYPIHQALEERFAAACGREAALLFNSGFQANATILPLLCDRQSLVLCDRLVHNSLIQGILASSARWIRYPHNDLDQLEQQLQRAQAKSYNRIVIVTETVFSMDGDCSDVDRLVQLADQYDALLYLDDAHALGVMGKSGLGLAAHRPGIDLVIGTFGKAFGSFGAVVTCSKLLRDYLINCCPGFIYTTALPPAVIGAIDAALTLMPDLTAERQQLANQANQLRSKLQALGYETGDSASQIVPILLGEEERTLHLSQWLEDQGILATAIRPPTVAAGTARIRLALSCHHTENHLNHLLQQLQNWEYR